MSVFLLKSEKLEFFLNFFGKFSILFSRTSIFVILDHKRLFFNFFSLLIESTHFELSNEPSTVQIECELGILWRFEDRRKNWLWLLETTAPPKNDPQKVGVIKHKNGQKSHFDKKSWPSVLPCQNTSYGLLSPQFLTV